MDHADLASHAALAGATAVYAVYLESLKSSYHPNRTYWTVVAGVALTGAGVAFRIALDVPDEAPRTVAWWMWWQVFNHFITSGAVIGMWQVWKATQLQGERRHGPARSRRRGDTR